MPNGFHGSSETWQRLIKPLEEVDELLSAVADSHGMNLTRNERGWPERSLCWGTAVQRKLQIYLADEKRETFTVWITAWKDGARGRAWRNEVLRQGARWEVLREELAGLIRDGVRLADSWSESDLRPLDGPRS